MDKVIRDGKVAVLYSPGFGAGWSTWSRGEYDNKVLFDPMIVQCVEAGDFDKLNTYMTLWYPDMYLGGMDSLEIAWLPEGALFRITEYDGSESIEVKEDMDWMVA
jgi:hypothetical protein